MIAIHAATAIGALLRYRTDHTRAAGKISFVASCSQISAPSGLEVPPATYAGVVEQCGSASTVHRPLLLLLLLFNCFQISHAVTTGLTLKI